MYKSKIKSLTQELSRERSKYGDLLSWGTGLIPYGLSYADRRHLRQQLAALLKLEIASATPIYRIKDMVYDLMFPTYDGITPSGLRTLNSKLVVVKSKQRNPLTMFTILPRHILYGK